MRPSVTLIVASIASLLAADLASAQPRPERDGPRYAPQVQMQHEGQQYYYNGRWVDQNEWQRRDSERQRWARNHQRRRGNYKSDDNSSLVAGIVGFALGAAIVGSQQDADQARNADRSGIDNCARRFRSYDRNSRTYLGNDGLRHYCVR